MSGAVQSVERTFAMIKPDAVAKNQIADIKHCFERGGLSVIASKTIQLQREQVQEFYETHKDRPFFPRLVNFISSGPVVVMVLGGDHAVARGREIIGDKDPAQAKPGTIRHDFGNQTIDENAVHGSDSEANARKELAFFFTVREIYQRSQSH